MRDLRTSTSNSVKNVEPGHGWNLPEQLGLQADACNQEAAVEVDAMVEQQLKQTQVAISS